MTFCATYLGWLTVLFTLALGYDLYRRARPAHAPETGTERMALGSLLKAMRDPDMLDAWTELPAAIWHNPKTRAEATAAIRAYVQRPTCPIARADWHDLPEHPRAPRLNNPPF